MRGRNNNNNRRNTNVLTRSYESNGPDIKVRGTASHIAEKYVQLARDAHVAGDPVAAENYLQHAEHYFRLIAAAHAAQNPQPRAEMDATAEESDDDDFDGGANDRFTYRAPQSYHQPAQQGYASQPFVHGQYNGTDGNGMTEGAGEQPQPGESQPYGEGSQPRQQPRFDQRNGNRFDRNRDNRGNRDFQRQDGNRDGNREGNRFEGRRDRGPRNDFQRNDHQRFEASRGDYNPQRQEQGRPDQGRQDQGRNDQSRQDQGRQEARHEGWQGDQPRFEGQRHDRNEGHRAERVPRQNADEAPDMQPVLPSFITAPVRSVPIVEAEAAERAPAPAAADDAAAPARRRGRRKAVVSEGSDSAVDTPAAE